jgi:UDP-GlcNAc:undecaprenyl-phosphate GlcNAc-1-phosphate transferase
MPILLTASLFVTIAICSGANFVGASLGLMDRPDGQRKLHHVTTPMVGGVALMAGLLPFHIGFAAAEIRVLFLGALAFFALGAADDRRPLSPLLRFVLLIAIAATLLWMIGALRATQLVIAGLDAVILPSELLPPQLLPLILAIPLVGFIVSVNMADGVDGLATGLLALWAGLFLLRAPSLLAIPAILLFGTLLVIWSFNVAGRLFMGDSGIYGAASLLALLIFDRIAAAPDTLAIDTILIWMVVPVLDCLRLTVMRTLDGKSPFAGDRNHLHHKLLEVLPAGQAVAVYLATAGIPAFGATLAPQYNAAWLAVAIIGFALMVNATSVAEIVRRRSPRLHETPTR